MTSPVRIIIGDVRDGLRSLAAGSVQCCVTSPPYWGLRDYGVDGQIGLEATPERFVETMVEVFGEVRRVLRDDGTLWLNMGDSYFGGGRGGNPEESEYRKQATNKGSLVASPNWKKITCGLKPKDLCMMPWRVAMALQADGWWLRSVICWHKRSPMPESISDRPTSSWEPIFLLAKRDRYYYDAEAVKERLTDEAVKRQAYGFKNMYGGIIEANQHVENRKRSDAKSYGADYIPGGRNMRNVWSLSAEPYSEAHFATFPSEIPRRAIRAGTSEKGCCPACGAPWERVVERTNMVIEPSGRDGRIPGNGQRSTSGTMVEPPSQRTVGWTPGCACPPSDPVPCVVLDPFLGSGTTIAAARQLGRHGVGIELNPTYADMARVRIGKAEKPHTFADHREPEEKGLFA